MGVVKRARIAGSSVAERNDDQQKDIVLEKPKAISDPGCSADH